MRLEPSKKVFPSARNWELILYDAITCGVFFLLESDSQLRAAQ